MIRKGLADVRRVIGERQVRLVAVSKYKSQEEIMEAYEAGQRVFGENYWNELAEKAEVLPKDINWHFIGHLQTRRVKDVVLIPNVTHVESVDSIKLASKMNRVLDGQRTLNVFVQVNTSGEDSKSGVEPGEPTLELCRHIIAECQQLKLTGLMTIGKLGGDPKDDFEALVKCKKQVETDLDMEQPLELSMGMSGDYEIAIEAGSTNVRVGSKIFGARKK